MPGQEQKDDTPKKSKKRKKNRSLELLRAATKSLAHAIPGFDANREWADIADDTLARVGSGLASTVMGTDENGDVKLAALENLKQQWNSDERRRQGLPKQRKVLPGIVTDTLAIPSMFGGGPEFSQEMEQRASDSQNRINEDMGLEAPMGFRQNAAQSAGVMLGQIPVPGKKAKEAVQATKGAFNLLKKYGKKVAMSPWEFLAPTVEPGLANYALGTAAGGAMGTLADVLAEPEEKHLSDLIAPSAVHKAKGGKVKTFDRVLDAIRSRYPKPGVFSVLDNLIEEAPFEKGTAEQWKAYLKPGREHIREGVRFPLRPDELRWGGKEFDALISGQSPSLAIDKDELLRALRKGRPEFYSVTHGGDQDAAIKELHDYLEPEEAFDLYVADESRPKYDSAYWRTPGGEDYHEWETGIPNRDINAPDYESHFGPNTVSWSRIQEMPEFDPGPRPDFVRDAPRKTRLVDELQSDLHQAATWKNPVTGGRLGYAKPRAQRKGYSDIEDSIYQWTRERAEEEFKSLEKRTPGPDDEDFIDELQHSFMAQLGNPEPPRGGQPGQAPFMDEGWIRHELQKNLLQAAENGNEGLAVVHPETVGQRYADNPGLGKFYEMNVIPELRRLAQRYGAEMGESGGREIHPELLKVNERLGNVADRLGEFADRVDEAQHDSELQEIAERAWTGMINYGFDVDNLPTRVINILKRFRDGNADNLEPDALRRALVIARNDIKDQIENNPNNETLKPNPTLKLTPELRDKIKRIGVPLFGTIGAIGLRDDEDRDYAEGGKVRGLKALLQMISINPDATKSQKKHMIGDELEEVLYSTNEAQRLGLMSPEEAAQIKTQTFSGDDELMTDALMRLHEKLFPTPEALRNPMPWNDPNAIQAERNRLQGIRSPSGHGKMSNEAFEEMLMKTPRKAKGGKVGKLKKLFHQTGLDNWESIKKLGLKAVPDEEVTGDDIPGVNMVNSVDNFFFPDDVMPVHLEIDTRFLDPKKFIDFGSGFVRYLGPIPPKAIRRVDPGESNAK